MPFKLFGFVEEFAVGDVAFGEFATEDFAGFNHAGVKVANGIWELSVGVKK